ncbi:MAG: chorismate-binding protein [Rhodocyclaceae bacterium]|nr:chorismate-binding protein [Rhodocyclaceae bacterium]MCA3025560.1 chorismate-binding protein [Rhodocyclaceae bacterium]MCA3033094.1 chorismate-binding protein [Rhodocyclaceae bacterium]MCA3037901.1 chorismate-binding protein [Rhodocyclaceae bacterium]MCA3045465.1 chorismate-binding protein [Rhodocyclaceae bacterium]
MTIRCEIDFPLLPTLSEAERQRLQFSAPLAVHIADRIEQVQPVLDAVCDAAKHGRWCVGFVAHEAAPAFDPALVTQAAATPLVWFAEFASATVLPSVPPRQSDAQASYTLAKWIPEVAAGEFCDCVESIRRDIRDGRFYQVNYTTRLSAAFTGDAQLFYRALQANQPNGYQAFIDGGDFQLLSVSPELFFSLRDGQVTTQPMKGTAPRGDTAETDTALAAALTHSAKERAENLMIVDLLRNDLSRIAEPHSVEVPHLFSLHALPSVWSMTSTVQAKLLPGFSLHDVFRALFPCGSVTGAPKVEAMHAIRDLEASPRGAYCGAIGMVEPGGAACFNVGIRSVWIEGDDNNRVATFGVGSGITFDSTVEGEAAELVYKSRFVQRASKPFDLFETIRLNEGQLVLLDRHLARMANSARHFRFAFDEAAARSALASLAREHASGDWRIRLSSKPDGAVSVEVFALESPPLNPRAILAKSPVSSVDEFLQHKTTRRETYQLHAPPDGIWDTLLWNERGELTEFIRANVVLDLNGKRFTPPVTAGLLNGTMRDELIARGEVAERVLTRSDLERATTVWWVNGLRGELKIEMEQPDGGWGSG